MSMNSEVLLQYLGDEFGIDPTAVSGDTLLFTDGLLDSFAVGDLLVFLEEQGDFEVQPEEVVPENLDSIDRILAYCERKTNGGQVDA